MPTLTTTSATDTDNTRSSREDDNRTSTSTGAIVVRGRRVLALLLLLVLAVAAIPAAEACSSSISKRPARPRAPPTPAPSPPSAPLAPSPLPQRPNVTYPTYRCPHTYSEYYCLNKAKCFTVIIQDTPLYNCECKEGFVGQRCEYKDLDGSYILSKGSVMLETASIATGALVALLLAGLVFLGAWVLLARSRSKSKHPPPAPSHPPLLVLRQSNA